MGQGFDDYDETLNYEAYLSAVALRILIITIDDLYYLFILSVLENWKGMLGI